MDDISFSFPFPFPFSYLLSMIRVGSVDRGGCYSHLCHSRIRDGATIIKHVFIAVSLTMSVVCMSSLLRSCHGCFRTSVPSHSLTHAHTHSRTSFVLHCAHTHPYERRASKSKMACKAQTAISHACFCSISFIFLIPRRVGGLTAALSNVLSFLVHLFPPRFSTCIVLFFWFSPVFSSMLLC